jgi:hypothetical protein
MRNNVMEQFFFNVRVLLHLLYFEIRLVTLPVYRGDPKSECSLKNTWWFLEFDSLFSFQQ